MCATALREHREDAAKLGCLAADGISLLNFKTELGEEFGKQGKTARKRKDRPLSTVEQDFEAKRKGKGWGDGMPNQYLENLYKKIKCTIFRSLCKQEQV